MIHHIRLLPIQRAHKTRMPRAIHALIRVLMKDAAVLMLLPALRLLGRTPRQLQQAETVERRVDPRGGVDDEGLVGVGVCQLGGAFVGGEVGEAAGWDLFPEFGRDAEDAALDQGGGRFPGRGEMGYAEVRWPSICPMRKEALSASQKRNESARYSP